jgi:hypothetical protein
VFHVAVIDAAGTGYSAQTIPGMGETIIFLNSSNSSSSRNTRVTNNGYKITVCSTTWYGIYSIEVTSVPLLQKGDPVLFMFQTQSNSSLQERKSTDMV